MKSHSEIAGEIVNQYDGDWQVIKERGELAVLIAQALSTTVRKEREAIAKMVADEFILSVQDVADGISFSPRVGETVAQAIRQRSKNEQ